MNLYFSNTSDQDPTNTNNWWDGTGGTGTNGYTPSGTDDCFIDASQTCADSNFTYGSLTVNGTLTTNTSGKVVLANNGTVTNNDGTITANNGTVSDNRSGGVVVANNNTITTRSSGGTTTNEYEAGITIPSGYTVTNLNASITSNAGTIGTVAGVQVDDNNGTITTVSSTGVVNNNYATITTNAGTVNANFSGATIGTNSSTGNIYNHDWNAVITTNNGTLRIGTVTGGTGNIRANAATNLASHTAGTNVTLPSGNTSWW